MRKFLIVVLFYSQSSFSICEMFAEPELYGDDSYNEESYFEQRNECLYNSVKDIPISELRGDLKKLKIKYMNNSCKELGFKKGTKDFNNCLLELM